MGPIGKPKEQDLQMAEIGFRRQVQSHKNAQLGASKKSDELRPKSARHVRLHVICQVLEKCANKL